MHDLVLRGATVVDGLAHDPIRADVAVRDGRIAAIGEISGRASEIIDAGGLTLMPGIIDALRAGVDWRFQSFVDYMAMLRGRGSYMNLGVLVGHSAVRTAVMGDDASVRKEPTAAELAEMKRLDGGGRRPAWPPHLHEHRRRAL